MNILKWIWNIDNEIWVNKYKFPDKNVFFLVYNLKLNEKNLTNYRGFSVTFFLWKNEDNNDSKKSNCIIIFSIYKKKSKFHKSNILNNEISKKKVLVLKNKYILKLI